MCSEYSFRDFIRFVLVIFFGAGVTLSGQDTARQEAQTPPGTTLWSYSDISDVSSSPAIHKNRVYAAGQGRELHAIRAKTGENIWTTSLDGRVTFSSPVVANGRLFVGGDAGHLYAVNADSGKRIWTMDTGSKIYSSPAVFGDTVFVGGRDGKVYALNASSGKEKWTFKTEGSISSSPAISENRVFIGSEDHSLYALKKSDGTRVWSFETGDEIDSSPAVAGNRVFVGSDDGSMYAVSAKTGEKIWSHDTGHEIDASPAVAGGCLFVGTFEGLFVALDTKSGERLWTFRAENDVWSSPAVVDDRVYFGSHDRHLYALNAKTGNQVWKLMVGGRVFFSSPVVAGDRVLIGIRGHGLRAVKTKFSDDESGWPVFGQNTGRTGGINVPEPTDQMRKDLLDLRKALQSDQPDRAAEIVSGWKNEQHPLVAICRTMIRMIRKADKDNAQDALATWSHVVDRGAMYYPEYTISIIRSLHDHSGLQKYLEKWGRQLGSSSFEKRQAATRQLQNAGILALPVLTDLRKSEDPEILLRTRELLLSLRRIWPSFFE